MENNCKYQFQHFILLLQGSTKHFLTKNWQKNEPKILTLFPPLDGRMVDIDIV